MLKAGNTVKIRQPAHRHGIWYFYVVSYYPKNETVLFESFSTVKLRLSGEFISPQMHCGQRKRQPPWKRLPYI